MFGFLVSYSDHSFSSLLLAVTAVGLVILKAGTIFRVHGKTTVCIVYTKLTGLVVKTPQLANLFKLSDLISDSPIAVLGVK